MPYQSNRLYLQHHNNIRMVHNYNLAVAIFEPQPLAVTICGVPQNATRFCGMPQNATRFCGMPQNATAFKEHDIRSATN